MLFRNLYRNACLSVLAIVLYPSVSLSEECNRLYVTLTGSLPMASEIVRNDEGPRTGELFTVPLESLGADDAVYKLRFVRRDVDAWSVDVGSFHAATPNGARSFHLAKTSVYFNSEDVQLGETDMFDLVQSNRDSASESSVHVKLKGFSQSPNRADIRIAHSEVRPGLCVRAGELSPDGEHTVVRHFSAEEGKRVMLSETEDAFIPRK